MASYGYIRCCPLLGEESSDAQGAELAKAAEELGGSLSRVFVDPGFSGKRTAVLGRPAGQEMLATLRAGDTLIVSRLDRLGHSMQDLHRTLRALWDRDVRLYTVGDQEGGALDLPPAVGKTILRVATLLAKTEKTLRSERATETAQWRKKHGLAYGPAPMGQKIEEQNGVKALVPDLQQLAYIAEVAERLGSGEHVAKVAEDFWRRGIKDRRGRLWGMQTPKLAT